MSAGLFHEVDWVIVRVIEYRVILWDGLGYRGGYRVLGYFVGSVSFLEIFGAVKFSHSSSYNLKISYHKHGVAGITFIFIWLLGFKRLALNFPSIPQKFRLLAIRTPTTRPV